MSDRKYPDWLDKERIRRGNPYFNATRETAERLFDKWERPQWEATQTFIEHQRRHEAELEASRCPTCGRPTLD